MSKVLTSTENMPYEQWLEWRRKGIGGSDASVVCGINKYRSPIELWLDKTGQAAFEEAGEAAYWGTLLEPVVREEFTKRTGIEVKPMKHILQHEDYPFMLANLDGICETPDHGTCIFEAKTASSFKTAEWDDKIPDEYMLQIQHYMAVTGFHAAYIAVLIGGNTFKWKLIERDDELIKMLIGLEAGFWNHVTDMTPPSIDGSDACEKYLAEKFLDSIPSSRIDLPLRAAELIAQYDTACSQLETLTEQKKQAENLLKEMLGENEYGVSDKRIVSWKNVSLERLDSRTLKAEHPALYKKYTNKTSYRRFAISAAT